MMCFILSLISILLMFTPKLPCCRSLLQFGFRQGHSTHHALIALVDKITKSLDNRDIVIGVFFLKAGSP